MVTTEFSEELEGLADTQPSIQRSLKPNPWNKSRSLWTIRAGMTLCVVLAYYLCPTADQRISNGIAFLDEAYGAEWRTKINWKNLRIASPKSCVLGQLEGSYSTGLRKHNLSMRSAYKYGFLPSVFASDAKFSGLWRAKAMLPITR